MIEGAYDCNSMLPGKCGSKPEKPKEQVTYRFELSLEPSEAGYAEFNYLELVSAQSKENGGKHEGINAACSLSPKGNKCLDVCDGFNYDKVIGYDTADSFIDDSELFDEYVEPSPNGFHIRYHSRKKKTVKCPKVSNVPKSKVNPVLTLPKKLIKLSKKRSLPSDSGNSKRPKCNDDDDMQIIQEIFKSPISKAEATARKTCDTNVTPEISNEYPLPSNLSKDLKKCLNLLKESVVKGSKGIKLNDNTKTLLISVEEHLLSCNMKTRSSVYLYLAHYLCVSSATLKRKSKLLLVQKLTDSLDEMIMKLSEEIKTLRACDISNPKSKSLMSEQDHSAMVKGSSENEIEDCKESKTQNALIVAEPLQSHNESNITKKFITPTIKNILKTIFCLKRKLYEVKKIKTKHFHDELLDYVREDLIFMWSPLQRRLQPLLEFANEYFILECHDMKVYKVAKDKSKENLTTQNESLIFANNDKTGCNVSVKKVSEDKSDENITMQKYSPVLMDDKMKRDTQGCGTKPKKSISATKKPSPISSSGITNSKTRIFHTVTELIEEDSIEILNIIPMKDQKESEVNMQMKNVSPIKKSKNDGIKTLSLKKNLKLIMPEQKKSFNKESQLCASEVASSVCKQVVKIAPKILPTSDKASITVVAGLQNLIMNASGPSKVNKINPNVATSSFKPIVPKNIKFQPSFNIVTGGYTGKRPLMQNINNSQALKNVPDMRNIKFIKPQNITNTNFIFAKPSLPLPSIITVNNLTKPKNSILKSGEMLKDGKKVTLQRQKSKLPISMEATEQCSIQPKNNVPCESKKKDSTSEPIIIDID